MRLWLAAGLLLAPGAARAGEVVVLGGTPELVRRLSAHGHRVAGGPAGRDRADRAADVRAAAAAGREALFGRADFAEAVARLEDAARGVPEAGLERFDGPELARLHLDLGLARLGAGHERAARADLAWALRLDPDLALDPAAHGPPVRRAVEELRAEEPARPRGVLTVRTAPSGARIAIDGRAAGESPSELEVPQGPHYVLATADGRRPASARVEVGGARTGLALELSPATPEEAARAALETGDVDGAARALAATSGADAIVAVRRAGNRWHALVLSPGAPEQRLSGASARELADRVADEMRPRGPTGARAADEGTPAWVWIASAAVVATAGVVAAALLAGADDSRELAGAVE